MCLKNYGQRSVQEVVNKTIPKEKEKKRQCGYLRWLYKVEEGKEVKSKGERESYIQLNPEFQKITKRDKKAFFNEQSLITEENNKRGKTRDLFRKIRNMMGAFCPKMCTIKDKNGGDLVDTEEIKNRWKEYMEELYKKISMNWITVKVWLVIQAEILEGEVKWALGSTAINKVRRYNEISAEMLKSLKDDAIKV